MSQWIFLRGLTREARHWGRFPEVFCSQVPDADVILLDLPGNGRLHAMPSATRVDEMADLCRAELRARGIPPPYHLLALSLGAMVATAWSVRYPGEVSASVLMNTSLRPFSPFYQRLRPRNYPALLAFGLCGHDATRKESLILRLTSNCDAEQTEVLREWVAYRQDCPVSYRNALRQLLAAIRYRAPRRAPLKSILLLSSARDRLIDSRCSQRLARQWNVPLLTHPTAGHDLTLDDSQWVATTVRDWLGSGNRG